MKPFNLEKALAGEPVVCRNGVPAKISGYNPDAHKDDVIVGWVLNVVTTATHWGVDGCHESGCEDTIDLFMAPVKRKGWVNVYNPINSIDENMVASLWGGSHNLVFKSEEIAKSKAGQGCIATVPIEWEE